MCSVVPSLGNNRYDKNLGQGWIRGNKDMRLRKSESQTPSDRIFDLL